MWKRQKSKHKTVLNLKTKNQIATPQFSYGFPSKWNATFLTRFILLSQSHAGKLIMHNPSHRNGNASGGVLRC